jgi:hypothetical protein
LPQKIRDLPAGSPTRVPGCAGDEQFCRPGHWGTMLNGGRAHLLDAPHLTIFPGLAIALLVLGFNVLGDGLRDVTDPRNT